MTTLRRWPLALIAAVLLLVAVSCEPQSADRISRQFFPTISAR